MNEELMFNALAYLEDASFHKLESVTVNHGKNLDGSATLSIDVVYLDEDAEDLGDLFYDDSVIHSDDYAWGYYDDDLDW